MDGGRNARKRTDRGAAVSERKSIAESTAIEAPAGAVWDALTQASQRVQWWSYLDLMAEPGGRFEARWTAADGSERLTAGRILALETPRLLRMTWADDDWPAETIVEIRVETESAVARVTVVHSGWEALPGGNARAEQHAAGWRTHLANLRLFVEGGAT